MVRMTRRDEAQALLRAHEPELKAAGIHSLKIFGSTARGDNRLDSDIDLAAQFDKAKRLTLVDMVGFERRLSEILGAPVDLADEEGLKERVRENFEREAVIAF